ncbi:hypothetical protein IAQ61_009955 [Plenodomus lingam]|uniref:uncharacterized protein n=1 Tax=Leptosphaeria maculans TaxID=5022 RepID=UPI0033207482|nr:hypothetical protein IAQ61_009955 [Plenodomus lingam]
MIKTTGQVTLAGGRGTIAATPPSLSPPATFSSSSSSSSLKPFCIQCQNGPKAPGHRRSVGHAPATATPPETPRSSTKQARDESMPGCNVLGFR